MCEYFAFDNEDWITGDLGNYADPVHLHSSAVFRHMLRAMTTGTSQIGPFHNVDPEGDRLRERVRTYHL